jgi:hypothetical protein
MVFGGQHLDVPVDVAVEIELVIRVEGERGWVHLRHDLVSNEDKHFLATLPVLGPGDSVRLRYRMYPGEPLSNLNSRMFADLLGAEGPRLEFEKAELRFLPRSDDRLGSGIEVLEEVVERQVAPPQVQFTLAPAEATLASCASAHDSAGVLARDCSPGEVMLGPRFYAPLGSRLEVAYHLEGLKGVTHLFSAVGSQSPPLVLERSPVESLEEGDTLDLLLSLEVGAALNELVLALMIEESSPPGSSFRVLDTTVTMVLP